MAEAVRGRSSNNQITRTLDSIRGAMIFWVPCCAAHCGVRTEREKYVGICILFMLLYPFLYILLGIIGAVRYGNPLLPPLIGLFILLAIFTFVGIYSFFPRSLERSFRIENIDKPNDLVVLNLRNEEYLEEVVANNEMHVERLN